MRKRMFVVALLPLLVLILAGTSYAWQGRMGGMGDPYGLVADESDYLIHPAKIANGEGIRLYGDYRFTYTGVTEWALYVDVFDVPGDEQRHDALVGAAFPVGPGRMGLFFTYAGMRGDYDGGSLATEQVLQLTSDFDEFAVRLLYGLPIGGFNLGGEVQFAYRQEENELYQYNLGTNAVYLNDTFFSFYLCPYDSHYGEALFKGSLEGKAGPLDLEFTLRGGFLFGSANEYHWEYQNPPGTPQDAFVLDGGVQGWRIGGDFWARYQLGDGLTLPLLVRVDYQQKTRDGDGLEMWGVSYCNYEHERTDLSITAGGGVDKEFDKDTRIAAGIYYNYLQGRDEFALYLNGVENRAWTMPDVNEHRALLRIVGERRLSPMVALRAGLNGFYGWRKLASEGDVLFWDYPAEGSHWGVGVSVGGTITVKRFTFEPFISGGYQGLDLVTEENIARNEWNIGGGVSGLFGL